MVLAYLHCSIEQIETHLEVYHPQIGTFHSGTYVLITAQLTSEVNVNNLSGAHNQQTAGLYVCI